MKVLFIGDIHGITSWKEPALNAIKSGTKVVFLGDYVDTHDSNIKPYQIYDNLVNIIEFKKTHPDSVTLLLGNHDYAYVFAKIYTTGFNFHLWWDYRQVINDNWDLFDIAWGFQGKNKYTLVTHAGLTSYFYGEIERTINDPTEVLYDILVDELDKDWKELPLHELLNYFKDQVRLMWKIGIKRNGDDFTGSIIWADKKELCWYNYQGINQIVGHTNNYYIEMEQVGDDQLFFIDAHYKNNLSPLMLDLI